jgi:hypothetical protein
MTVMYKISIGNLRSMDEVVSSLRKLGLDVIIHDISPVEHDLEITLPEESGPNDIFALGTYVGSIQIAALR